MAEIDEKYRFEGEVDLFPAGDIFFSREEPRTHVHVLCADGESKFWLDSEVEARLGTLG